jgi:hypothetical protein
MQFRPIQRLANQFAQETAQQVNASLAEAQAAVEQIKDSSAAWLQASSQAIQQATADNLTQATTGIAASGQAVATALQDLPTTAAALAQEMPKLSNRFRLRAGLRVGDAPRTEADIMALFEKIPGTTKLGASETKIREFLADKHGSHILPRSQGGSNSAENILWEIGTDNLRRGANVMAGNEQVYIRFYNAVDSIVKNSGTIARLGLAATGTAVLTQAIITAVAYTLDLYRGDLTIEEFRDRVLEAALTAGLTAPIFFLILTAVLALFPELTVLLAAPAVVAGFNAMLGFSIALPIVQSLLRHAEASGLGANPQSTQT